MDSACTLVAIQAALKAGQMLRHGFNTSFQVRSKSGIHNLVTEWDTAAEKSILSTIAEHYPDHRVLAEESGMHDAKNETLWVIDPLDGTVNFAHGIPFFSVSIAVVQSKEVHAAVVYCPMLNDLFIAEKGKGASLNGTRLSVSSTKELKAAFLATGFPYDVDQNPRHCVDAYAAMQKRGMPIRRIGSAALDLAYVAAGRFDAFWELHLSPWDSAAGQLLVEEAGGKITQYDGSPYCLFSDKTLIASNTHLHQQMVDHLKYENH